MLFFFCFIFWGGVDFILIKYIGYCDCYVVFMIGYVLKNWWISCQYRVIIFFKFFIICFFFVYDFVFGFVYNEYIGDLRR